MSGFDLRDAAPLDAGRAGEILWRFQEDTPWMPKLHSHAEAIAFCSRMIDQGLVRVGLRDGRIEGFLARRGTDVIALYCAVQGQGLGRQLLHEAQATAPALELWTFQANTGAQRFYLRHGFAELRRTNGAENDEGLPDILYRWERSR